jgi:quinolinate synthase
LIIEKEDSELTKSIRRLKQRRGAVILAHNYQRGEVQDIADFVGDSLELSQKAAKTDAEVIVFCGVYFMAETASIICPGRTVLLPELSAGCPMANMITAKGLREKKGTLPGVPVVCYINSFAEVKAESDICCTSSNALKVIQSLEADEILFVPDQYLGSYIAGKTAKKIHLWPGYCPTHTHIQAKDIISCRQKYPGAAVIVHPECRPDVVATADEVLSTGGMCRFARGTDVKEIIVGTEAGILHRLRKENPDKTFIPVSERAVCPNMKLTTLESVLLSLQDMSSQVKVPEDIRIKARTSIDKMLEIAI